VQTDGNIDSSGPQEDRAAWGASRREDGQCSSFNFEADGWLGFGRAGTSVVKKKKGLQPSRPPVPPIAHSSLQEFRHRFRAGANL
jgi:hypothetical protein